MCIRGFLVLTFFVLLSCSSEKSNDSYMSTQAAKEDTFDKELWNEKKGEDYVHRTKMYEDVLYSDELRTMNQSQIVERLGSPDRQNDNHLYYMIQQKRLIFWPLTTKTLVIKMTKDDTVEWIKVTG